MKRDSYIFYRNWWETFRNLPDEVRLEVYDGIMKYAFDNDSENISIIAQCVIDMAKPLIDKDRAKYEAICERNKANGSKGGRPKTQEQPRKTQENPLGSLGSEQETQNNPKKPYNDKMINDKLINNISLSGYEKFDLSFIEESFKDVFFKWLVYKKGRGEKYKVQGSLESAYKKLKELSNNNPKVAEQVIEQSFANNWAGMFALKNDLFTKDGINTGVIQKEGFEWNT